MKTSVWCLAIVLSLMNLSRAEDVADPMRDPVVLAVQKVVPAVVNINTERLVERQFRDPFDEMFRQFFGQPQRPQAEGGHSLGSGVIVDQDGWLVTNFHVIRRATKISAVLADGSQYEARFVSGDEKNDLALLKIEAKKPFAYVEIASEQETMLGETVLAIGNPFGLDHTVTKGIISAKNRKYTAEDVTFEDILQTDAAINPGNSGGPLVNLRGQLVGINMAMLSQASSIGFAIPAKRVANLLGVWFSPEKRARLWFGARFGRDGSRVIVTDVQPDSPAGKAGLKAKDVIVTLDGLKAVDVLGLQRRLIHKQAGDAVKLDVQRAGKSQSLTVTLAALPNLSATDLMWKKFGLQVQMMTPDLAAAMGVSVAQGLLVSDVEKNSPGAAAGFRRGLIITHVGGEEVQSLDRLAEELLDVQAGEDVGFAVIATERRGNFMLQQALGATLKSR
jgi:serine protease Do